MDFWIQSPAPAGFGKGLQTSVRTLAKANIYAPRMESQNILIFPRVQLVNTLADLI